MSNKENIEEIVYPIFQDAAEKAWISRDDYRKLYQKSIDNPDEFWGEQAQRIS